LNRQKEEKSEPSAPPALPAGASDSWKQSPAGSSRA
jgi:hypothetical protein